MRTCFQGHACEIVDPSLDKTMNHKHPNLPEWRLEALRMLPELSAEIREAENPYLLWITLRLAFEDAYSSIPHNDLLIGRIYEFARWCFSQPRGESAEDDLLTCVYVCFIEHISENKSALGDLGRWLSIDDFAMLSGVLKDPEQGRS
jgi:hypothetical protein